MKKLIIIFAVIVIVLTLVFTAVTAKKASDHEKETHVDIFEGVWPAVLLLLSIPMIISEIGLFTAVYRLTAKSERRQRGTAFAAIVIVLSLFCLALTIPLYFDSYLFGPRTGTLQLGLIVVLSLIIPVLTAVSVKRS